jgi:probable rRNA maturation factor
VSVSLTVSNRQRKKRVDMGAFRVFAESALVMVQELIKPETFPEEINLVFVSDARIAQVHRNFMSVEGPTDVITFHHGEIIISVETAERQADKFSTSFERELQLYFVHGLLHLAGLDDITGSGFQKMAETQEKIVASLSVTRV